MENIKLISLFIFSIALTFFCLILAYRNVKKRKKLTDVQRIKKINEDNEKEGIAYLLKGILETIQMLFK